MAEEIDAAGAYLFGDEFSIADIYLMTCLDWGRLYDIPLPVALSSYQHRVGERPAYLSAFAANNSERTIAEVR